MKPEYYLCDNGHTFHKSDAGEHTTPQTRDSPAEHTACCPKCGDEELMEVNYCNVCGEVYADDEKHECEEDAR